MRPLVLAGILAAFSIGLGAQDEHVCDPCTLRISPTVAHKLEVSHVDPVYPPDVRASGIAGTVHISYVVNKHGSVARALCAGTVPKQSPSLNAMICSAAREAVLHWKYRPYLLNGQPAEVEVPVTLSFDFSQTTPSDLAGMNGFARPSKYSIPPDIAAENLVHRVDPEYPVDARKNHVQGDVVLKVLIGKDGHVQVLEKVSGDATLESAARDAVEQWVYTPYLVAGEYVLVETKVKVSFHL